MSLLYARECAVNDKISIMIPTVGEILEDEANYYAQVMSLTAMPIDMMVQLDDLGIDFTAINEYDLFLLLFGGMKDTDMHLIFGNLDTTKFQYAVDEHENVAFVDVENDIVIDRSVYEKIASAIRRIHHLEKNTRTMGNEDASKYILEREREKLKRKKKKTGESQLDPLIVSLVNTQQFKYDYEGTKELSIFQFNESVRQIINKVDYDNRMLGVYTGNISTKDLKQEELSWLRQAG